MPPEWQGCRQQRRRSMWGLPGVGEQQWVPGPGGSLPRAQQGGHAGFRDRRPEGPVLCRCTQKQQKPICVYCLLSSRPLSFHTQKQACKYHNNKAGIEFLFWKTMNISLGFGSYRMKLFFLQEGAEIIS